MDAVFDSLLAGGGIKFAASDFRSLCGPIVYLFMLRGRVLYAGMSGTGLARPGGRHHHHADRARAVCDEVLLWPCKSRNAAKQLESIILNKTKPLLNQRGKYTEAAKTLGVSQQRIAEMVVQFSGIVPDKRPPAAEWDGKR